MMEKKYIELRFGRFLLALILIIISLVAIYYQDYRLLNICAGATIMYSLLELFFGIWTR